MGFGTIVVASAEAQATRKARSCVKKPERARIRTTGRTGTHFGQRHGIGPRATVSPVALRGSARLSRMQRSYSARGAIQGGIRSGWAADCAHSVLGAPRRCVTVRPGGVRPKHCRLSRSCEAGWHPAHVLEFHHPLHFRGWALLGLAHSPSVTRRLARADRSCVNWSGQITYYRHDSFATPEFAFCSW
jgi:hypothetical protein